MTDDITPRQARRDLVLRTARQVLDLCWAHVLNGEDVATTRWVLEIWLSEFSRQTDELRERGGLTPSVIEASCREAAKQHDRDVHLHYHRKEDAWTITVGDREVHATAPEATGYGKSVEAAVNAMRPLNRMQKRARVLGRR